VNARTTRYDAAGALDLARQARQVVAARRDGIHRLDPKSATQEELLLAMLGPSGHLRAPTIRRGSTLYVGFSEQAWAELLR
jgi:arsenate reductase-like glutaredoxin family protein